MNQFVVKKVFLMLLAYYMLLSSVSVWAKDVEQKPASAKHIVEKMIDSQKGFVDAQSMVDMVLRTKAGDVQTRTLDIKVIEEGRDRAKSLVRIDEPRDLKGVSLLVHSAPSAQQQWIYFPSSKRVKRISSNNKSGKFISSEFSFEDLSGFDLEDYSYKRLADTTFNGRDCYVIEQYPNYKYSAYSKIISVIDKQRLTVEKVDYFDLKGSPLKSLTASAYKKYQQRFWRAEKLTMKNLQTGNSTQLILKQLKYNNGFKASQFNISMLKRTGR